MTEEERGKSIPEEVWEMEGETRGVGEQERRTQGWKMRKGREGMGWERDPEAQFFPSHPI